MMDYIALGILGISVVVLLSYYLFVFTRFSKANETDSSLTSTPISVIIAARNEIENLKENLPEILNQAYANFEVIVVNDGSYDGTKDYLDELSPSYPHLKPVHVMLDERFQKGKKFALTMGIKAAKNDRLVFTDADCKPTGNKWLQTMATYTKSQIVLGIAPLETKKTLLGSLVGFETFHTALQMVSYANSGLTYMGLGRNVSYTKSLFFANKGFASHQHVLSGDDDLFIQEVANKTNVNVCLDSEAFMNSPGAPSFKSWFNQKKRHLSASSLYKSKYKWLLGTYSFAQLLFVIAAIMSLVFTKYYLIVASVILLKWLIQFAVMLKPAKTIAQPKYAWIVPYYDLLYTFYLLLFGLLKPFIKVKTWR